MQAQIHRALDQAAADRAVVVLTGRPGVWTAGFAAFMVLRWNARGVVKP